MKPDFPYRRRKTKEQGDKKLNWSLVISAFAALLSVGAIYFSYETEQANIRAANYGNLIASSRLQEEMLRANSKHFEMHGITQVDLQTLNVTHDEVLYVLVEMRADLMFYKAAGFDSEKSPSDYRKITLKSDKFRQIYIELLFPNMISKTDYICHLNAFIYAEYPEANFPENFLCSKE